MHHGLTIYWIVWQLFFWNIIGIYANNIWNKAFWHKLFCQLYTIHLNCNLFSCPAPWLWYLTCQPIPSLFLSQYGFAMSQSWLLQKYFLFFFRSPNTTSLLSQLHLLYIYLFCCFFFESRTCSKERAKQVALYSNVWVLTMLITSHEHTYSIHEQWHSWGLNKQFMTSLSS